MVGKFPEKNLMESASEGIICKGNDVFDLTGVTSQTYNGRVRLQRTDLFKGLAINCTAKKCKYG